MKIQENGFFMTLNQWAVGSNPTEVTKSKGKNQQTPEN